VELGKIIGVSVGVGGINEVLEMTGVADWNGVFVIGTAS
jgi:hypothetical protein